MKNSCLLLILAASLTLFSCNKDDDNKDLTPVTQIDPADDPAAVQLTTQLLTAHNWELTALTQGVSGQPISSDLYHSAMQACQRDDVYTFSPSGNTITVTPGLLTCAPSEVDKTGTWNLKNAKTLTISVSGIVQAGLTGEFSISMLNNSKMILRQTLNGNEFVATYETSTYTPPAPVNNFLTMGTSTFIPANIDCSSGGGQFHVFAMINSHDYDIILGSIPTGPTTYNLVNDPQKPLAPTEGTFYIKNSLGTPYSPLGGQLYAIITGGKVKISFNNVVVQGPNGTNTASSSITCN